MRREDDADTLGAFDDVIVGDDVAVGIDDDAGAEAALAADGLDFESLSLSSSSSSVEPKPVTWTSTTAGETRFTRFSNEALIWRIMSADLSVVMGFCAF